MTPEALLERLAAAGIAPRVVRHPPVFTVSESRALRGELPGVHSKNLFLARRDGGHALAVLEENRQVSVNGLARAAGWGRVSMGSVEALRTVLGVEPGSVTPLGLVHAAPGSVAVALDAALAGAEELVWFHPLVNTASVGLRPEELLRFLRGLGHAVAVLRLGDAAP